MFKKNTSYYKNNMIYRHVVKEEGLYQNKVSYSLISSCNCKIGY